MVRAKKIVDTSKQAELQGMLIEVKAKFKNDKKELEEAKRNFSTVYVQEVLKECENAIPQGVLEMRAKDFLHYLKQRGIPSEEEMRKLGLNPDLKTPFQPRKKFKSITTPGGIPLQIPSLITPRVDGEVLRSRMSRQGEVLFSVNGTPVTLNDDMAVDSTTTTNEQAKIVEELLQKKKGEMSPATYKIMQQLRVVLCKNIFSQNDKFFGANGKTNNCN